jgi:hypothetical protein
VDRGLAHEWLDGAVNASHRSDMLRFLIPILVAIIPAIAQEAAKFHPPKEVAPGVFEVGTVRLDKNARTVTVPAKVNMTDGLVEYYCVSPTGSTHESVIVSDAGPQNVHVAMLLLGAKGAAPKDGAQAPGQIDADFLARLPKLVGDRVMLSVRWKDADGKEQTVPAERWVMQRIPVKNKPAQEKVMEDGPWLYNGSYLYEGRFVAEGQGMFVAINTMPSALINNPRPGANNDKMWFVNTKAVPPVGTPVDFIIKLENAQETQK